MQYNSTTVHGQRNASSVFLAGYSNFGPNLTFAVPTNVPSTRPDGSAGTFGGTSAANPVMAGYASLIWSVNPELEAGEVRQLLADTVTDVGAAGRDNTFGHGIPNVSAAVREAWAHAQHHAIATIAANPFADVEPEEIPVDLNATEYHYDLGTLSSPLEAGFDLLTTTSSPFASWTGSVQSTDRDHANSLERDFFHSSQAAKLEHRISNGIWDVTISTGDADSARDNLSVAAEGLLQIDDLDTALGEFAEQTFRVRVEDGQLSLTFSDLGGDTDEWVLNRLSLEKVSDLPGYAGDFDTNSMVEGADLNLWADQYGTDGAADANLDRSVSGFDFLAWQQTLGAGVITRTTLIDGSLGNGSFEDQTDAVGLLVDPLKHRVYTNNTATASIDGWTATVSNGIGGWDGELAYVASDGNAYALANDSAVVTFTSDAFTSHSVAEGDSVNVSVDVGSSNGVAHDYQAQIVLGANTYDLGTISDGTLVSGGAGETLNTISFSHTATAADAGHHPQLILTIENQGGSSKAYLDNVHFEAVSVAGVPGGSSSQSSSVVAASTANEPVAVEAIEFPAARVALPLEQPVYFDQGVAGETFLAAPRFSTSVSLTMLASEGTPAVEIAAEDVLSIEKGYKRYEWPLQLRFSEQEWLDLAQSRGETGILTRMEAPH
ncbi:MAG: S8 family serine peptidase, partial [Lacipirellulaceae bacterium]